MNNLLAFDSHKQNPFARVESKNGENPMEFMIEHRRGSIAGFLSRQQPERPADIGTVCNWYWVVDGIEQSEPPPLSPVRYLEKSFFACKNMHLYILQ